MVHYRYNIDINWLVFIALANFIIQIIRKGNLKMLWRELKISFYGSKKEIPKVEELLNKIDLTGREFDDRNTLQRFIDENKITKVDILYDGNTIVSKDRIVNEFIKILKKGKLEGMSDYFYKFLHLYCGSSAHYNKQGWIYEYNNSSEDLINFFLKDERGTNVLRYQPRWKADCINISREILFIIEEGINSRVDDGIKPLAKPKKVINNTNDVSQMDLFSMI